MLGPEGKQKHKLVLATTGRSGSTKSQTITDKLSPVSETSKDTWTAIAKLERPMDLPEGEHTPVWAILGHDANNPRHFNSSDKTVERGPKEAPRALVLKIWWDKDKK